MHSGWGSSIRPFKTVIRNRGPLAKKSTKELFAAFEGYTEQKLEALAQTGPPQVQRTCLYSALGMAVEGSNEVDDKWELSFALGAAARAGASVFRISRFWFRFGACSESDGWGSGALWFLKSWVSLLGSNETTNGFT